MGIRNIKRQGVMTALLLTVSLALGGYSTPIPRVKPDTPGPTYIAQNDYHTLEQFFSSMDKRRWTAAETLRTRIKDPVARNIADWAYYRAVPERAGYRQIGAFLDVNLGWPRSSTLQRNGEKQMKDTDSVASIAKFFAQREPLSGRGKRALARAELAAGHKAKAAQLFKAAWIEHDWPITEERSFLSNFGKYLDADDHAAKLDRQLFDIRATSSKRLLPLLTSRERRMAEARIALLLSKPTGPRLFNELNNSERKDSGVLHAATRYFRRRDAETTAITYAALGPISPEAIRNPESWWVERRLLMRWALKNAKYQDAYNMAAFSGLREGASFSDAEFTAGWIALRFLHQPKRAREHFAFLDANVTAPISKARAQYWIGRTWEAEDNIENAHRYYAVASAWPFTYYGQLAAEKLDGILPMPAFPAPTSVTADERAVFNARPLTYAMRVLSELGRDREFIYFARALDDQIQTTGELVAYHEMMREEDKVFLSVRAAKAARKQGAEVPEVSYPLVPVPERAARFVEKGLILGLSRQESEFNPRAYSSAKARGMMQLLSSTARITARKEGIPYSTARLMDDPSYNMLIGAAHLSHLLAKNEGSYILTFVGYNAGPRRIDRWIREYGDPRNPNVDPIDWVELIPFSETRNYVMRVLENTQIYRAQVEGGPIAGKLSRDLTRGGSTTLALEQSPSSPVLAMLERANQSGHKRGRPYKLPAKKPAAASAKLETPLPPSIASILSAKTKPSVPARVPVPVKKPALKTVQPVQPAAKPSVKPTVKPVVKPAPTPTPVPAPIVKAPAKAPVIAAPVAAPTPLDEVAEIILQSTTNQPVPNEAKADDLNAQQLVKPSPSIDRLAQEPAPSERLAPEQSDAQTVEQCSLILSKLEQLNNGTADLNTQTMVKMLERDAEGC